MLDLSSWQAAPRDLRRRLIQRALLTLSPSPYPPAYDHLTQLAERVGTPAFTGQTLNGCLLRQRKDTLWVMREPAALPRPLPLGADMADTLVWDHRFAVAGLSGLYRAAETLAPLGEAGWQDVARMRGDALWPDGWPEAPAEARYGLPALFSGAKPVAVPQLSWQAADFRGALPRISPAYIV
jgi:hypothetical protein